MGFVKFLRRISRGSWMGIEGWECGRGVVVGEVLGCVFL